MDSKQIKKYSLEIILFVSSIITIVSFMMLTSQGAVEQNQKFIEYVTEYSKMDLYLVKVMKSMSYGDAIYTDNVVRFYVRVTEEEMVKMFDKQTFSDNVVLVGSKSYSLDFRIDNPKVYIDPDFVQNSNGYGIVVADVVYSIGGSKGNGVGYFIVFIEYKNGVLSYSMKYAKLVLPSLKTNLYLIYLEDKGVFKGYSDPKKLHQLFTSRGEIIDPVNGEAITIQRGGV